MFIRKRALDRIAKEKVLFERGRGGDIGTCLVYPNIYRLAMANLGFQAVFQIFDRDPSVTVDRAFLPDPDEREAIRARREPLLSFEHGRPLSDFEILAFSISFETDYLNLVAILEMAGIPFRRADREGRGYPLVVAGGSAVFLNPEPIADFVDLCLIGEGEEMIPEFLALLSRCARSGRVREARPVRRRRWRLHSRTFRAGLRRIGRPGRGEIPRPRARTGPPPHDQGPRSVPNQVADSDRGIGLRRHVSGRGEPWMSVGMPLLRRGLHVSADPLPKFRGADRRRASGTRRAIGDRPGRRGDGYGARRRRHRGGGRRPWRAPVALVAQGGLHLARTCGGARPQRES